jgi:hypothetical protein
MTLEILCRVVSIPMALGCASLSYQAARLRGDRRWSRFFAITAAAVAFLCLFPLAGPTWMENHPAIQAWTIAAGIAIFSALFLRLFGKHQANTQ